METTTGHVMRCLVTGDAGFVGSYLVDLLRGQDHEVFGFDLKRGEDIRGYEAVRTAIDKIRPDKIFHLAALAYVPESFADPRRAIETNTLGSLNILEAVRNLGLKTKIHLCGTSEEYGDVDINTTATTELTTPNPRSPYAVGKLGMEYLGKLYSDIYNMHVVTTRTFNHTGPGRGEMYAESAWAKQIVEIEKGIRKELLHGNLEPKRNYTDVRDIVHAYTLAIDLPSGVYNICSDQNVSMGDVLSILKRYAECDIPTRADSTLMRPTDFSFKAPSCDKFKTSTGIVDGWKPYYTLEVTLGDLLNDWREKLK